MTDPKQNPHENPAAGTVLHVLEHWGTGGTERYVADLGAFLAGPGGGGWRPELAVLRGDPPAPSDAPGFAATGVLAGTWGLRQRLEKAPPAVVHLHLYSSLLPAVRACRRRRVPAVVHLHIPLRDWGFRHRLGWRLAVRLARGGGHVCGVARDVLRSVGLEDGDGRGTLVPPPIPVPDPAPGRPPRDPGRPFELVGVGRLADQKDWPTLLNALPAVRDGAAELGRGLRFVHLGGGERAGEFAALVRELGLEEVVDARGPVPHSEVAAALDAADLFVLPSRFEGLGIAPLEAMARGLPAVVADFPAAADYVVGAFGSGGETAHAFPRGDVAACAGRLLWHLRNPTDGAAVGARGRAFVAARFTPAATFGRLPPLYAGLAGVTPAARKKASARSAGRNR